MLGHYILLMAPQGGDASGGFMQSIILFGLIFVIFYFMIIRPQQKRQKERQKMIEALKKGDKVVTTGGIHGTIAGMEEKTLLIQIERGSVTTVAKEAELGEKIEAK